MSARRSKPPSPLPDAAALREARVRARREGRRLAYDPAEALAHLKRADPDFAPWLERCGEFTLAQGSEHAPGGVYESLLRAIVAQQVASKAARTVLGRVLALYGGAFPTPAELAAAEDEKLRATGLWGAKVRALKDLGAHGRDGLLPDAEALDALEDEEVITALTRVRGIGRWTVEMLLLFQLGRPDVYPVKDLGVQKGFGRAFLKGKRATPEQLEKRGARWRPYRSMASWYLWRVTELPEE